MYLISTKTSQSKPIKDVSRGSLIYCFNQNQQDPVVINFMNNDLILRDLVVGPSNRIGELKY